VQDHELIEKIKTGNAIAFQELFERYKKLVINVCYRLVGNRDEAEDLTQDVFLKIFRSAQHFKHRSKVSTWIYRIAINLSLNHLRRKKYHQWFSLDDNPAPKEPVDLDLVSSDCPESAFDKQEQEKIVLKAINQLPADQRIAVMLQRYDGLSCQEIAAIAECSVGAVQARLHRAKKNLYQKLLPYLKEI
jgi:RNA polymerase sigma-70 factor (ECF subfamily)